MLNEEARFKDQKVLHNRLDDLESNQNNLKEMLSMLPPVIHLAWSSIMLLTLLDAQHFSPAAMMVSLQRVIERRLEGDREHRFFSRCVRYLSTVSGPRVRVENWMITWFDMELGAQIGSGGL